MSEKFKDKFLLYFLQKLVPVSTRIIYYYYCIMAKFMRRKSRIKVLFVISDVTVWKSERLYLEMLNHPRFEPILCIVEVPMTPNSHLQMMEYCKEKGYQYLIPNPHKTLVRQYHPEIIMYQKPYYGWSHNNFFYHRNISAITIHLHYGLHTHKELWGMNQLHYLYSWQYYFENDLCAIPQRMYSKNKGRNVVVTGVPTFDELNTPKSLLVDPWKDKSGKKRIIWAPHHTIGDMHLSGLDYSTFLSYYDFMLKIAEKYKDKITIAFKPHAVLRHKLDKIWGKKRTDDYYAKWENMSNTQYCEGKYLALFKYSDAMIHDCGAFKIEYMYTCNPVMFLTDDVDKQSHNLNDFALEALKLHYIGKTKCDIEQFILNLLSETDELKQKRLDFYSKNLLPPSGNTACQNIISAILGE